MGADALTLALAELTPSQAAEAKADITDRIMKQAGGFLRTTRHNAGLSKQVDKLEREMAGDRLELKREVIRLGESGDKAGLKALLKPLGESDSNFAVDTYRATQAMADFPRADKRRWRAILGGNSTEAVALLFVGELTSMPKSRRAELWRQFATIKRGSPASDLLRDIDWIQKKLGPEPTAVDLNRVRKELAARK
ncbi:MAG: hypothetical protein HYV27_23875 [Candidatus Hydrogenedentes bacterium]|nr:hypothetical protein [Candidatus Hydrogenedentota bacterium]